MQLFRSIDEWRHFRRTLGADSTLGFVPTMGNLHLGHASLLKTSIKENTHTIASLFINPTQFDQVDDFNHYPQTLEDDLNLLTQAGVDYCLLPDKEEMYADNYHYQLQENNRSLHMEGQSRPGHFTGVLTIVMKLFNLVKPHRAYFGEKDYQQLELLRDMTNAFFMDIDIKPCPTIRETSGLAYSSRNARLTTAQRHCADQFARVFHKASHTTQQILTGLKALPLTIEYLEEHAGRRFIAVKIGTIRLIDNYKIT